MAFNGTRGLAALAMALNAACSGNADDSATAPPPASAFSVTLNPNAVRLSPGGSGLTVATIHGGTPPVSITLDGVPNDVTVRVASATIGEAANTVKLIIAADAAAVPGTYPIGIRCTTSDTGPDAVTQLTLTIATP